MVSGHWKIKTYLISTTHRLIIDLQYLLQGHHLKHNKAKVVVHFFLGYVNKIRLPNPELHFYNSQSLTFTLVPQEEAGTQSVSGRMTRSRTTGEGRSSQQPPILRPRIFYVPGTRYGGTLTPKDHEARGSKWAPSRLAGGVISSLKDYLHLCALDTRWLT
jgi:hypothetical protein